MFDIIIIGGGAAGVSATFQCVQKLIEQKQSASILLVEKSATIGGGLSYSTQEPDHILNLGADIMSADPNNPHHFLTWLEQKQITVDTLYPPRALFGEYLADVLHQTQQLAQENHIRLQIKLQTEALRVTSTSNGYAVLLSHHLHHHFTVTGHQLLLCLGHLPSDTYAELQGRPGYFHTLWDKNTPITQIPPEETAYIVGSRLTAIDAALSLVAHGHQGHIIMMSRSGFLPCVIGSTQPYTLQKLTVDQLNILTDQHSKPLSLDQLLTLFWEEIAHAEGHPIDIEQVLSPSITPTEWLRQEITVSESQTRPWQSVLVALYPLVPMIWRLLSEQDKQRFLTEFYSPWMSYLAAFPIDNAHKVLRLLESGQLIVLSGLKHIAYRAESSSFQFTFESGHALEGNYLINGTGQGYHAKTMPLLRDMINQALLIPNPFGGVRVDIETLQAQGNNAGHIVVVGELTRGDFLATTDMSQVVKQLQNGVQCLINNMLAIKKVTDESESHLHTRLFQSENIVPLSASTHRSTTAASQESEERRTPLVARL